MGRIHLVSIRPDLRLYRSALIAVLLGALVAAPGSAHAGAPPVRGALPSTRLEFGLSNDNTSWMTSSGVPWRYRFTYLAGGTNTQNNWLTWQDPAKPPGQFALDYMAASSAPPAAYIPVFTWYQLLQSAPSSGSSELDRDYNNLNNAATMSSYYASFKVLMQKAAEYGGQVVVHVEPDMWGYMQQKAAGGGASSIAAMAASSGFAEAAAFPDNLVGFAATLKHLRDTYAPNALLAMHASMWSSSIDIASDTNSNLNAPGEADKTAAFLSSAGAGAWDALFNDVDDHNAAWWELASCGSPPCVNQYFTHWWDASNTRFPNFTRYLSWVAELHSRTALPQVVWQVPMGNQYFLTMNNTCGHYQDNVAPYFIAHPNDLFNAGLIAVLFGPGNSCQTSYDDARNDGVSNNGGASTSDPLGSCSACNTNASSSADDDGGYLRIFVGRYYSGQATCQGTSARPAPQPPQASGTQVVFTASATGCPSPLFQFWTLAPGAGSWQPAQVYSSVAVFTWNTTGLAPGSYGISVWVRDSSSGGVYGNAAGRWDGYASAQYALGPSSGTSCSSAGLSASPAGAALAGAPVSLVANARGCSNPLYQLWVLAPGAASWQVAQPYSTSPTFSWNTNGLAAGAYGLSVWVRDASSAGVYGNGSGRWDAYASIQYRLSSTACTALSVSTTTPSTIAVGTPIAVSARASGCPSPLYEFWVLAPGAGSWQVAQAYSSSSSLSWSTAGRPVGTYRISVWARDGSSSGTYSNSAGRWDAYNSTLQFILR